MNAQGIIKYLEEINPFRRNPKVSMMPDNVNLVEEIFHLAKEVEPYERTGLDIVWEFWLWTDKGSYEEFEENFKDWFVYYTTVKKQHIDEDYDFDEYYGDEDDEEEVAHTDYEKLKEQWPLMFPDDIVWFRLRLYDRQDDQNKLISFDHRIIAYTGEIKAVKKDLSPLLGWILEAERRCVDMIKNGTYSEYIDKNLPYKHRSGFTKMAVFWKYVPEDKERIFGGIDPEELTEFQAWDENEDCGWNQMTSNDYFDFCNILYDLLDLKKEYPLKESVTPKECYMAYAANYSSSKPFKDLDGDSAEAFDHYITKEITEHHTWEVCLVPNIHLYPKKAFGKFYISLSLEESKDYPLLVHLALELRKRGIPLCKPEHILEEMSGEQLVVLVPDDGETDCKYTKKNEMRTAEYRRLPKGVSEESYKEIQWFPVGEWHLSDE